jgi:hypothetical protein
MIERAKATESERAEPPGPELAERDGDALTARPAS